MKAKSRVVLLFSGCLMLAGTLLQFPQLLPSLPRPRPRIERLTRYAGRNVAWEIHDGRILTTRLRNSTIEIAFQSLRGANRQIIATHSREDQVVTDILLTEKEALYITRPANVRFRSKPDQPPELVNLPYIQSTLGYGDALPFFTQDGYLARSKARTAPDETRREVTRMDWTNQDPAILHRISLSDGKTRSIPLDTQGCLVDALPRALTADGLYWVRPGLKPDTQYIKSGQMHLERLPQDALMFTPLTGKPARTIQERVALTALYACGSDFVCGRMPRVYPDTRHSLVMVRSHEGKVSILPEFDGLHPPVDINGRLFWFENRTDANTQTTSGWLLSCKPDGSDRRLEWQGQDEAGQPLQFTNLFVTDNRFYAILFKRSRARIPSRESGDEPSFRDDYYLTRLSPDNLTQNHPLYPLPQGVGPLKQHTEGDYFYFLFIEARRNPLDFLSEQVQGRINVWLCRMRLP